MRIRASVLALALLAGAVVAIAVAIPRPLDPKYQGRHFSVWLDSLEGTKLSDAGDQARAEEAIRQIGTNAIPYLTSCLQYEPPLWRRELAERLSLSKFVLLPDILTGRAHMMRSLYASHAIRLLGTNAYPAIPQLAAIAKNPHHPQAALRAIALLAYLGPPGWQAAANVMADETVHNRENLISFIMINLAQAQDKNLGVHAIAPALKDDNPIVRETMTNLLHAIAPELLTNTPAK